MTPDDDAREREQLRFVGEMAQSMLAPNRFFLVAITPPDPQTGVSSANYIGDVSREEARVAMKEIIARWEGQPMQAGNA